MKRVTDLNADLGEGFGAWTLGDDDALLAIVTSANVACGFHAGDATTMRRVCGKAAERGVAVGAQVGYRDLAGFGRRRIDYEPDRLRDELMYQIGALSAFGPVAYVKPHGALYNTAAVDEGQARAVVDAAGAFGLPVLCQPGLTLATLAEAAGLRVVSEGFADRAYLPDGRLVPRSEPGALLGADDAVDQAVRFAARGAFESVCVHGDTPHAVETARRIRDELQARGIGLEPFTGRLAGTAP